MPVSQILRGFRTDCATTARFTQHSPLSFRAELGGEGGKGGNLSFFLPFFLKANAVQNHFTVGLGLFIPELPVSLFKCWLGFFPSYSSLNEGDSCFFYVSLKRELMRENNISDSSSINPKCLDQKPAFKVRLF